MKRVSGLLMLLLVALLFSMPVAADDFGLSNDLNFEITSENKISDKGEVAGYSGEMLAFSVDPCRPEGIFNNITGLLVTTYNFNFYIKAATYITVVNYRISREAGGPRVTPGST
ncbi:MAG: hypothetical protein K9M94_14965 [Spirochaetia bacterium]|nr:hypothetical protein [Spirochaetia bacterium]